MIVTKRAAVAAITLAAAAGTAVWLAAQRQEPSPNADIARAPAHPPQAIPQAAETRPPEDRTVPAALPRDPEPLPVIDPFAGDMDGDGRLSVEEWFALEHRPSVPRYWTDEELVDWRERWDVIKRHASGSADPYAYYDDETKIALAEAGDWRAKRDLLRLYSKTGRVHDLKRALLERVDPTDPDLAKRLMTLAYSWEDRQPLLAAAFFGAAEELRLANSGARQMREHLTEKAERAGISYEEMRDAGRQLLAELEQGGMP